MVPAQASGLLSRHVDDRAPALVDQDGRIVSYRDLSARSRQFGDQLGSERRLVFLEAAQTVDAIAAYAACRDGRHPVFLYGSGDEHRIAPLIERYAPNALITTAGEESRVNWLHRDAIDMHEELAVLL